MVKTRTWLNFNKKIWIRIRIFYAFWNIKSFLVTFFFRENPFFGLSTKNITNFRIYQNITNNMCSIWTWYPVYIKHYFLTFTNSVPKLNSTIFIDILNRVNLIGVKIINITKWKKINGPVPIKDMQKFLKFSYLHERCGICWNELKNNFPNFSLWDMVVFLPNVQNRP